MMTSSGGSGIVLLLAVVKLKIHNRLIIEAKHHECLFIFHIDLICNCF